MSILIMARASRQAAGTGHRLIPSLSIILMKISTPRDSPPRAAHPPAATGPGPRFMTSCARENRLFRAVCSIAAAATALGDARNGRPEPSPRKPHQRPSRHYRRSLAQVRRVSVPQLLPRDDLGPTRLRRKTVTVQFPRPKRISSPPPWTTRESAGHAGLRLRNRWRKQARFIPRIRLLRVVHGWSERCVILGSRNHARKQQSALGRHRPSARAREHDPDNLFKTVICPGFDVDGM